MTTNLDRFVTRHRAICARAEREFAAKRKSDRRHSASKAIRQYAANVHRTIQRRDDLASILAVQCAYRDARAARFRKLPVKTAAIVTSAAPHEFRSCFDAIDSGGGHSRG